MYFEQHERFINFVDCKKHGGQRQSIFLSDWLYPWLRESNDEEKHSLREFAFLSRHFHAERAHLEDEEVEENEEEE